MTAIETLERVFADKVADARGKPRIGVFGNGPDPVAIEAAGCGFTDVKSAPASRLDAHSDAASPYIEPFLDPFARVFLNRLMADDFAGLAAIVFDRTDAAAFAAYLYAIELRRIGVLEGDSALLLSNHIGKDTEASRRFDDVQREKLRSALVECGGHIPTSDELLATQEDAQRRESALARMKALNAETRISGTEALQWRNAGRYLPGGKHARLLTEACEFAEARAPRETGARIGVVGSALDAIAVYRTIETSGTIVCDLQPFGELWPLAEMRNGRLSEHAPTRSRRAAQVERLLANRCDFVVAQYDENDDSFGWELPGLKTALADRSIPLVDLGFRPHRPDQNWLDQAAERISQMEGRRHV